MNYENIINRKELITIVDNLPTEYSVYKKNDGVVHANLPTHNSNVIDLYNRYRSRSIVKLKNRPDKLYDIMRKICGKSMDNVLIAGGAVNTLVHENFLRDEQDIDMFVIGPEPVKTITKLVKTIKNRYVDVFMLNPSGTFMFEMTRTISAITITMNNLWLFHKTICGGKVIKLQIVLNEYSSIDEVLNSFDIDCCCVGIHKKNMYCNERFLYSFHNNILTINNNLFSPSYVYRLYKYYHRGYDIRFPRNIVIHYECGEDYIEDGKVNYYLGFKGKSYDRLLPALTNTKAMRIRYLKSMKGIKLLVVMMMLNIYTTKFVNSSGTINTNKLDDVTYSANNDETFAKIVAVRSRREYGGGNQRSKITRDVDAIYKNIMSMKYIDLVEEDLYIPKELEITSKHKRSFNYLDISEEQMYLGTY